MSSKEIFAESNSLSETQLQNFCKKVGLNYHIVDLDKIENATSRFSFIFTGNEPNEFNKGHDHHWMFLDGINIFDSYGKPSAYDLPEKYNFIVNHPRQLQEFGSTVCGEYCCAFYFFVSKNPNLSIQEIGEEFSDYFGFTKNKLENDKLVFDWYHSI
jgi:hypothetical protein